MKKNFRFCILFVLIFLFNTLIVKAEREVKKEEIELKNGIIYFKGEENSYNGIVKENYPNGKLKESLIVENGKVNGNVKVYYENGNLKYNTPYKNNKKEGIEKIYSLDGKLEMEVPYKNGVKDGVQKQYSKDGKLIVEATLKNNLRMVAIRTILKMEK